MLQVYESGLIMSGFKELVCFLAICSIVATWIILFLEQPIIVVINLVAWCVVINCIRHRN